MRDEVEKKKEFRGGGCEAQGGAGRDGDFWVQGSGVECVDDGINRKRVGLIRILTGIPKRKICNKFNPLGKKERHYNVGFTIFFISISLSRHI